MFCRREVVYVLIIFRNVWLSCYLGSRKTLEAVAAAVKKKQGMDFAEVALEWDEFLAIAPQSDDVYEYVADHPLYIPFKDELFGISEADTRYADTFEGTHYLHIQRQKDIAEAARAKKAKTCEVWRTMPCMHKNAAISCERVNRVIEEDGTQQLEPFYEDEDEEEEEEEELSSEDESDRKEKGRWCTVRRLTNVSKFGDARRYVGERFTRKTGDKNNPLQKGTIASVARNRDEDRGELLHYKLQFEGSDDTSGFEAFVACKKVMSTSRTNPYRVRRHA